MSTVLNSESFKKFVATRWSFSIIMSAVMLTSYFGFILTVALSKETFAQKVGGGTLTLGILVGFGIILLAWLLTGIYVWWANNYYDKEVEHFKNSIKNS